MNRNDYYRGIMVGFGISTILWCVLWVSVIGSINKVHQQEVDYLIEKHIKKNSH